ncbi:uncharacterized protein J3D65DRAFT_104644 [Phyllosticta citribraziliensis]|uniref:Uncharacterized protein n=1 Tax=Phyllosticta citribraziliensis TaxID=989973 RepID=A0ABR1LD64_9PEZI
MRRPATRPWYLCRHGDPMLAPKPNSGRQTGQADEAVVGGDGKRVVRPDKAVRRKTLDLDLDGPLRPCISLRLSIPWGSLGVSSPVEAVGRWVGGLAVSRADPARLPFAVHCPRGALLRTLRLVTAASVDKHPNPSVCTGETGPHLFISTPPIPRAVCMHVNIYVPRRSSSSPSFSPVATHKRQTPSTDAAPRRPRTHAAVNSTSAACLRVCNTHRRESEQWSAKSPLHPTHHHPLSAGPV